MAGLFDKVAGAARTAAAATGEMAKNAAEKGQDMVEIGKINRQIKEEESKIDRAKKDIGEILYARFLNGDPLDDAVKEYCEAIKRRTEAIDGLNKQIEQIKND